MPPQLRIDAALHDGEQILRLARAERALAALGPAQRKLHRLLHVLARRRQRGAFVQLHDDVGADLIGLDFDRASPASGDAALPSMWLRKVTPSASSFRSCASDIT